MKRKVNSIAQLFALKNNDWQKIVGASGTPDFIEGKDQGEKNRRYIGLIKSLLNAALPTQSLLQQIKSNAENQQEQNCSRQQRANILEQIEEEVAD